MIWFLEFGIDTELRHSQVLVFCNMMFPFFASVLLQRNSNSISVQHLRQQSAESGAKDQDAQAPPGVV